MDSLVPANRALHGCGKRPTGLLTELMVSLVDLQMQASGQCCRGADIMHRGLQHEIAAVNPAAVAIGLILELLLLIR